MAEPSPSKPLLTPEQGLRRTIILSLALHLAVLALFAGDFLPRRKIDERPVYVVDLLNLPVKDPQAGRPDAAREPQKNPDQSPAPPPEAAPVKPPEPVKPPTPPKAPEPPKPKPEPVKPAPKPEVVKPTPSKEPPPKPTPSKEPAKDAVAQRIEDLRRQQEMRELQEKLAALGSKDSRGRGTDAPVGVAGGKGTEAGTSFDLWIHDYLKKAWALSKYQVSRRDLEASVVIVFDPQGRLVDYRFTRPSGDERFDDSVRKAILQLKQLPTPPDKRLELDVIFNLKELLD